VKIGKRLATGGTVQHVAGVIGQGVVEGHNAAVCDLHRGLRIWTWLADASEKVREIGSLRADLRKGASRCGLRPAHRLGQTRLAGKLTPA
jgi:hypothetical protein